MSELAGASGPLSLAELAVRLRHAPAAITELVDQLEIDGLVRHEHEPRDRRRAQAVITALGRKKQRAGAERVGVVHSGFAARLSPSDRAAAERALAALRSGLGSRGRPVHGHETAGSLGAPRTPYGEVFAPRALGPIASSSERSVLANVMQH